MKCQNAIKNIIGRLSRVVSSILAFAILSASLAGCFLAFNELKTFEFSVSRITVDLGSEIDLYDYLDVQPIDIFGEIGIAVKDENIVSVNSALSLKALSVGETTITLSMEKKTTSLTAKVVYNEPSSLELFAYGELYQLVDDVSYVDFTAVTSEHISPDYEIIWLVDDEFVTSGESYFSICPSPIASATVVTASISDTNISDSVTIYTYEELPIKPTLTINDMSNVQPISYSGDSVRLECEAVGAWEFFVNGESVQAGFGSAQFTFSPTESGSYELSATLYGEPVAFFDGSYSYVHLKKGKISPTNLRFEYDNTYPNSYIYWDMQNIHSTEELIYVITITAPDGTATYYTNQYSTRFEGECFDSSGIVGLLSSYIIEVEASHRLHFDSGEPARIMTTALDRTAANYLEKRYLDKNYFITSDAEFFELYDYTIWLRPGAVASGSSLSCTIKAYMGYSSAVNLVKLTRMASSRAALAGAYQINKPEGSSKAGSVISIKITFVSVNSPSKTTENLLKPKSLQAPHISNAGKTERALAVDKRPTTFDQISTSNALLFVVEKGFRPNVKANSSAEKLYNYAQNILKTIINDEMTELERIHAIYDWILWQTHYDKKVELVNDLNESLKYSSYYIESVFDEDYPFAVCDGLSKTFSLLANMEGIRTIRVVGKADGGGNHWGDHAWNKVYYMDSWYLVDCTWGDYELNISGKSYETASHRYLMLSSSELSATHRENGLNNYPQTAKKPFLFLREYSIYSKEGFYYFTEDDSAVMTKKAQLLADHLVDLSLSGEIDESIAYFSVEVFVPSSLSQMVKDKILNKIREKSQASYLRTDIKIVENHMFVLIKPA